MCVKFVGILQHLCYLILHNRYTILKKKVIVPLILQIDVLFRFRRGVSFYFKREEIYGFSHLFSRA